MKAIIHVKNEIFLWENARVVIGCAFVGLITIASLDGMIKSIWHSIFPDLNNHIYADLTVGSLSDLLTFFESGKWADWMAYFFSFMREVTGVLIGGYLGYLHSVSLKKARNDTAEK